MVECYETYLLLGDIEGENKLQIDRLSGIHMIFPLTFFFFQYDIV